MDDLIQSLLSLYSGNLTEDLVIKRRNSRRQPHTDCSLILNSFSEPCSMHIIDVRRPFHFIKASWGVDAIRMVFELSAKLAKSHVAEAPDSRLDSKNYGPNTLSA